jgi:hypothetical protein
MSIETKHSLSMGVADTRSAAGDMQIDGSVCYGVLHR